MDGWRLKVRKKPLGRILGRAARLDSVRDARAPLIFAFWRTDDMAAFTGV